MLACDMSLQRSRIHAFLRPSRYLAAATIPIAALLLLTGCGGGTGTASTSAASTATSTSTTAHTSPSSQPVGRDLVHKGSHSPAPARGVGTAPNDEVNASGAKTSNPCTLVSRSEAEAIVGKPVSQPVEAPQGPTCIYKPQDAKSFITVAVESANFSKVKPQAQLHGRISVTVGGHIAYCGTIGNQMLIVPLSSGKFLAVTAPCPVAASFATKALNRL
jgi:hypothetical protein